MEHTSKELPFLDILIKNVNGQIITDIYHKPTDTQQPPKKLYKIYPWHSSTYNTYNNHGEESKKSRLKELHTTLNWGGYPMTLINEGLEFAEKIPKRELRNLKKLNNEKTQAYVVTYNKNNPDLFTQIIKSRWT